MIAHYRRVVLKISGEALRGEGGETFCPERLKYLEKEISRVAESVALAVVIGGGNIARGRQLIQSLRMDPVAADHIGMLGTVVNALVLKEALPHRLNPLILSSFPCSDLVPSYNYDRARRHFKPGNILILAGGSGNAGVSTDTAAVLRARDLGAELVLKGTRVDGIYTADPELNGDAERLPEITTADFLGRGFNHILDRSAVVVAEEYGLPIRVFDLKKPESLARLISGENLGSLVRVS